MPSARTLRDKLKLTFERGASDTASQLAHAEQTLLQQIFKRHCLLEVRIAGHEAAFQSAIIELVAEKNYFVLDALTPAEGNELTANRPAVTIKTRIDGMAVSFASRILARGGDATAPYYKAIYPDTLDYPQRRGDFRATVPLDNAVTVRFKASTGLSFSGDVRDLSPSGFSARVHDGEQHAFDDAAGVRGHCEIEFSDGQCIDATIEICHVFAAEGRAAPRVGACFVDLDARTERTLERYVASLERAQARLR